MAAPRLRLGEFRKTLLWHELVPAGPLPTACDPDAFYPYPSFRETKSRPVRKSFRFVSLENRFLRAEICPDLGGRLHSLCLKPSGKEVLYVPKSLRAARILPRQAFLPGGIEVSFPISHTPSQIEPVLFATRVLKDRVYLWCGEREPHAGLQWTLEFSLGPEDSFLTQRACFRNPTKEAQPWMSWSNAALPSRPDTRLQFPGGPVLRHDAGLGVIDWKRQGPRREKDIARMSGYFWQEPSFHAFGAYTPSLGCGLYHVADPKRCPGIKLWSYGRRDRAWAGAAPYLEIQAGPLRDQSQKTLLAPGEERCHTEFWIPSARTLDPAKLRLPQPSLLPAAELPAFGWARPAESGLWESLLGAWRAKKPQRLPKPPSASSLRWAPSGQPHLGQALAWAAARDPRHASRWRLQQGAWQAGRGDLRAALQSLARSQEPLARALEARLLLRGRKLHLALASLRAVKGALALQPQVVVLRDEALAQLGPAAFGERRAWLKKAKGQDERVAERRASLLADEGRFLEAKNVLKKAKFQKLHQRYVRTALWKKIQAALGHPEAKIPDFLGEDDLAEFGAYRDIQD